MSESEKLWNEQPVIRRSFFEKNEKMTIGVSFSKETFGGSIEDISNLKLIMGLKEDGSNLKFHPSWEWQHQQEEALVKRHRSSIGLLDSPGVSKTLRGGVDSILKNPYEHKGTAIGHEQVYVDFSEINWLDSAELPQTLNDLFYTRTKEYGGELVRASQYGVSLHVLTKMRYYLSSIDEVHVLFGAHYGRVPGMGMMFTPILKLKSIIKQEHNGILETVLNEMNVGPFESAQLIEVKEVKGKKESKIVYFNYLRPCPPYGDCGPG